MSDGNVPDQPRRFNKGLAAAIATAVVVLAVIGATAGWLLAGTGGKNTADPTDVTPSATPSTEPPIAEPSTEPTGRPSATAPAGGFSLPDVSNVDFKQARQRLRELGLGVQLYFGPSGTDTTVERTQPAAGQTVRRGTTIKVYVRGAAPVATVPSVLGLSCNQGGSIVADHGLTPEYPTGRTGVVLRQDPEPPTDSVRWNDRVRLYCGIRPATPTPTTTAVPTPAP